jgi:hypothetical protein
MFEQPLRCHGCGRESFDRRWTPFCPSCYEMLRQRQRREQVRPPAIEHAAWSSPTDLADRLADALGPELP